MRPARYLHTNSSCDLKDRPNEMKKILVLIVILLLTNSLTLLAQTKKAGTSASKKAAAKTAAQKKANTNDAALQHAVQQRQADSIAAVKAAELAAEKIKNDSLAKIESAKIATPTVVTPVPLAKKDSTLSAKKKSKKKDFKKDNTLKNVDSLFAKTQPVKVKAKSARQLKKDSIKNDINNLSEDAIAKIGFKNMGADSVFINALKNVKHPDIPLTNARTFALNEPSITNMKFFHRYWRDIDLVDAKNKRLATYHADLINGLLEAIRKKEIKAYNPAAISTENPTGDSFTSAIPYDQLMSGLSDSSIVNVLDKDGNIASSKMVANPFTPAKIAGYRIKEDVYYDKIRARTVTRIIGIAPLVKLTLSSGEILSVQPLCWLKFKDCRKVFATIDIDPTKKIGDSMDDIFLQRRFYGKIVQESNPEGKRIKDYKTEVQEQDAEAARMEQKVAVFKKGSWSYTMLTPEPKQKVASNKPVAVKPAKVNNTQPATTTKP
jgi:hypothetical protein